MKLEANKGIPRHIILLMAAMAGALVASSAGKCVPRFGVKKFSIAGAII